MYVSVIVPLLNEEENVERLFDTLHPVLEGLGRPYEIVFVDDGSRDATAEKLARLASLHPVVRVIHFRRNFGQTAAMAAGLEHAQGEILVTMDGDLQNDPADIPLMLQTLKAGYDLVHGWRADRQDAFWHRKLPSKIATWLISRVTGFRVNDLGCTLKAMRREVAQDLQLYGEMHRFIPILAHCSGARCKEIVTRHHPRRFGKTKYGLGRTLNVLLDLATVKYLIAYSISPMRLFGRIGMLAAVVSVLCGTLSLLMKLSAGFDITGNPLLYVCLFGMLAAVQFFSLGMLGEMAVRTYYESQGKRPYAIRKKINFDDQADEPEQQARAA